MAATLAPRTAAQSTPVAATVYTAWLQEVIDCDSAAAAETLSKLSYDTHTPKVDRWLATARLLELRRVGVGATLPSAILDDVPVELRDYFKDRTSEREDLQGLQQLVRQEDGKLLDTIRSSPRRGSFRPLVATTVRWAAEQNPELQKTRRLLWQQWQSARRAGNQRAALEASQKLRQLPSGQPGLLQREHALQILLRELDTRTSEADRLRRDYFPDWQKPRLTADTSTLLANATASVLYFKTDASLPAALRQQARVTGRIVELPAQGPVEIEGHLAALRQAGVAIEDVEIRKADLEDVFFQLMSAPGGAGATP